MQLITGTRADYCVYFLPRTTIGENLTDQNKTIAIWAKVTKIWRHKNIPKYSKSFLLAPMFAFVCSSCGRKLEYLKGTHHLSHLSAWFGWLYDHLTWLFWDIKPGSQQWKAITLQIHLELSIYIYHIQ